MWPKSWKLPILSGNVVLWSFYFASLSANGAVLQRTQNAAIPRCLLGPGKCGEESEFAGWALASVVWFQALACFRRDAISQAVFASFEAIRGQSPTHKSQRLRG